MLHAPTADPNSEVSYVAIAIKRVGQNREQRHVSFLYRRADGALRLSHLEWHKRFTDEPWNGTYHWALAGDLDPELEQPVLAARLASIESLRPRIPYGFYRRGCTFSVGSDGSLTFDVAMDVGSGLTCATYILAVLDSMGFHLLDEETWVARADDAKWQEQIIEALRATPTVSQAHLRAIEKTVGYERVRPEEVVGSFASTPAPFTFEQAVELGQEVLAELGT